MTATVQLTPTKHASKDEYWMPKGQTCECCDAEGPKLVGINASKGQRKLIHACDDCIQTWEDAPRGLYDPVVIATLD